MSYSFGIHRNCGMWTFFELSSIKTPNFFHKFNVNFALAPVTVLHPLQLQNGVGIKPWNGLFSRHGNFAILRKFCIMSHFDFTFFSETIYVTPWQFYGNKSMHDLYKMIFKSFTFPKAKLYELISKTYYLASGRHSHFQSKIHYSLSFSPANWTN